MKDENEVQSKLPSKKLNSCTFCGSHRTRISRKQRKVFFDSHVYDFFFCKNCFGYFIYPELTSIQLDQLYSRSYIETHFDENEILDVEQPSRFVSLEKYLKRSVHSPGEFFLDYGCGANPETLAIARSSNLTPIGMEFAPDVRKLASSSSGETVLSREELLNLKVKFSVIFLGDVLEHLVAPQIVLNELAGLLDENGVIISQGPLQGARTLTHMIVGAYSCITPKRFATYPPYHVTLAHSQSMIKLFSIAKLEIEHIAIEEVSWPAPTLNELRRKFNSRNLFLFLVKVPDLLLSKVVPMYGTRYFMVGKIDKRSAVESLI